MVRKLCVCLAFLALSLFALENLRGRYNPELERGGEWWRPMVNGDNHSFFSKDAGIDGSGAAVVSSKEETNSGFFAQGFVPIVGGRKYTVEARIKGTVKSGHAYIAAALWSGTKGTGQVRESRRVTTIESPMITECSPDIWSSVHITLTAPEECNGIHIHLGTKEFIGTIAFDNIAVYETDDTISIPQLSQPPVLDGKLDETFVKEAARFTDFMQFPLQQGKLSSEQTEVYVGMTTEHIYVAYLLHHSAGCSLKGAMHERDDTALFNDEDSIELFISPMAAEDSCCHLAINAFGAIYDAMDGNANWNAALEVATGKLDDRSDLIEFRMPLKELGYNHAVDAGIVPLDFKMSFCRNLSGVQGEHYTTWSRVLSRYEEPGSFRRFKGLGTDFGRNFSERYWRRENVRDIATKKVEVCWQVENPLYEELITDKPHPEHGEGAYIWTRPLDPINISYGLQYGFAYSRAAILKEYEAHRLHSFTHYSGIKGMADWSRETGIGQCLYFPYFIEDWSAPYNPVVYQKMFDITRKTLDENPDAVWGISLGDEAFEWLLFRFIDNANNPQKLEASPELREAVKTVKEQYGFGKYGVPSSSKGGQTERFEWLATKNYMFARTQAMQRDLYKLCQEYRFHGKPLVCISGDPMGGLNVVQQQSRDRNYCDIFTGQVVPTASRWRQNVCFTTKVLKDFTGKTVWPCAHIEPYSRSNDVLTTTEYLSQVARGGGSGLQIWNYDLANSNRGVCNTCFDYHGHRPRWDILMDVVDRFCTMGQLRFPKDEMAIYLSTDTFSCYRNPPCETSEALFTFAGPSAGAWFKFIGSSQLRDKEIRLNDWKVILIGNADVEYVGNQRAFMDYVKNGGTLVCFDPKAFSFNEDGTETSGNREELFGTKIVSANMFGGFRFVEAPLSTGISKETFYHASSPLRLEPLAGTKVLATAPDGSAAATIKPYPGGGRAVLFAMAPRNSHVESGSWRRMMRQFIINLGIAVDQDIWRFKFPAKAETEPVFKDTCLTGNYFYWYLNKPVQAANALCKEGGYSYTLPPDGDAPGRKYAFPEGNLCNRIKATELGDFYNKQNKKLVDEGKISTRMFFDTWSKSDAFEIAVDLGRNAQISTLKLFFSGELPSVTATLDNGAVFTAKGEETNEVHLLEIPLNAASKNIKLAIPARQAGKKLILSEMEIWGK